MCFPHKPERIQEQWRGTKEVSWFLTYLRDLTQFKGVGFDLDDLGQQHQCATDKSWVLLRTDLQQTLRKRLQTHINTKCDAVTSFFDATPEQHGLVDAKPPSWPQSIVRFSFLTKNTPPPISKVS